MYGKLADAALGLCLLGAAIPAFAQDAPPKWGPSIDVEGKIGNKRQLGEADLLVPFAQDSHTLLFGNARFRMDDASSMEGNFGLGVRHMHDSGWNIGAYGYYDRRETRYANTFNQVTFGAEALGEDFDLRANTYWPVGETAKQEDALNTAELSGTSVIFRGGEERALQGFDAEAGWRVPMFEFDSPYDFRVYAGGYHFYDPDDVAPDVTGPRLRAELTAYEIKHLPKGTRMTVGGELQHDNVRDSHGFFTLRLRIPLQSQAQRNRELTARERRMTTPIVRDVDIVAQSGAFGPAETATQLANGATFTVLNSASTTGANLPAAVTAAGANSTVILQGAFNTTAATVMQAGQTLMGAGTVKVRSPSGRTADLTTSSASITGGLTYGAGNEAIVNLANNTTVTGLTLNNTNTAQSVAIGLLNTTVAGTITLTNNTFTTSTSAGAAIGVRLVSSNTVNLLMTGNTITATGTGAGQTVTALILDGGTINATASGNTIGASGGTTNVLANFDNVIFTNSTGNIRGNGACNTTVTTGTMDFTDGTTCP